MKVILYCELPYSYEILYPLYKVGLKRDYKQLWYIPEAVKSQLKLDPDLEMTSSMKDLDDFQSDAILVPTNSIPHYLKGVKVQIFHGLAGEKKGHFRIRHYFDLYLTQGPYFTRQFKALAKKHNDFHVVETGWSKPDLYYQEQLSFQQKKTEILTNNSVKTIVLYAPTFSPSLASAKDLLPELISLANSESIYLFIKFHDKMAPGIIHEYKQSFDGIDNVEIMNQKDIIQVLNISDYLISDTSSVVYEFILLNKPALSYRSRSKNINWLNIRYPQQLIPAFRSLAADDEYALKRKKIIAEYHPYTDGKSSERMWDAVEKYISEWGVPEKRKLSFYRRQKVYSLHGKLN
ncbi:MAG: CDP-glycerol glycerophosphotransferase family protein [Bacteroidota bacterium]|nr:CDP-glycerol glycerophosphotransferase family protein [Bacteroidota bacterium]